MYDIIGDIHGHAAELKALLVKLGYSESSAGFAHESRTAIFVGDFIDRGPKIPEVLSIVRAMEKSGAAKAVMGNHEYNAICYHTQGEDGSYLREHSDKNKEQHEETVGQLGSDIADAVAWFKTLPLWLELDGLRVVHATWDDAEISKFRESTGGSTLKEQDIFKSAEKGSTLYEAVETLLKGTELALPPGVKYKDEGGHTRHRIRAKWYRRARVEEDTFRSYCFPENLKVDPDPITNADQILGYEAEALPVFFGHYWLKLDGKPELQAQNVCCLDYSVAKKGHLVAYRFQGERILKGENFVVVPVGC